MRKRTPATDIIGIIYTEHFAAQKEEGVFDTSPLSPNKWSQYQMDRWFRSCSAAHTKPKLRSQVQGTFVPNFPPHQSAEEMADRESE